MKHFYEWIKYNSLEISYYPAIKRDKLSSVKFDICSDLLELHLIFNYILNHIHLNYLQIFKLLMLNKTKIEQCILILAWWAPKNSEMWGCKWVWIEIYSFTFTYFLNRILWQKKAINKCIHIWNNEKATFLISKRAKLKLIFNLKY